jgi:phosphate transport system permease protein
MSIDFTQPLSDRRRWLQWVSRITVWGLALVALVPSGALLTQILVQGIQHWHWEMLFTLPAGVDTTTATGFVDNRLSGFAHALVGTGLMLAIALSVSLPLGIGTGIYLAELADHCQPLVRLAMAILHSTPSIIIGVFAYGVVVTRFKFSALAGGIALAVIMLPILALATAEALQQVPRIHRLASLALGVSFPATLWRLILPQATRGIFTGIFLAVARTAGETAPLLFTALSSLEFPQGLVGSPTPSLAVTLYRYATSPFTVQQNIAWAIALVLLVLILLLHFVSAGLLHKRSK